MFGTLPNYTYRRAHVAFPWHIQRLSKVAIQLKYIWCEWVMQISKTEQYKVKWSYQPMLVWARNSWNQIAETSRSGTWDFHQRTDSDSTLSPHGNAKIQTCHPLIVECWYDRTAIWLAHPIDELTPKLQALWSIKALPRRKVSEQDSIRYLPLIGR
jgi:hypothetical protein